MSDNLSWGGLALAPIILAVIEGLKLAGMPANLAPAANLFLSAIGQAVVFVLTTRYPTAEATVLAAVQSAVLFFTVAGLYDRLQPYFSKR